MPNKDNNTSNRERKKNTEKNKKTIYIVQSILEVKKI